MRGFALLLVALCAIAHASADEVMAMDAPMTGDTEFVQVGAGDADALLARTEELLGQHAKLLEAMKHEPTKKVLSLTHKIKAVQSHIKHARSKGASADSLAKHNHKLATLTIAQHDAASGGMNPSTSGASAGTGTGAGYGGTGAVDDSSLPDPKGLFSGWLTHWGKMRAELTKLASDLAAHVAKTKTTIHTQHVEVDKHMEKVKKAYTKEHNLRIANEKKAKEMKAKKLKAQAAEAKAKKAEKAAKDLMREKLAKAAEKHTKAVEAKHKQYQTEERLKKKNEKKAKELQHKLDNMPKKSCGAIREKEMKAKAEIKRLLAENKKIKADCERKSKEMTQKINKARQTIKSLKTKLAAAMAKISKLRSMVASLRKALAVEKARTAKQKKLKEDYHAKWKSEESGHKAAKAKIVTLTRQLAVMTSKYRKTKAALAAVTAKYSKIKKVMGHINGVSAGPHREE